MSIEENKKAARRFNEEPWNENKLAVLDELTARPAARPSTTSCLALNHLI